MITKNRGLRNCHKRETDRYEAEWHEILDDGGELAFRKTIWTSAMCYGYDSNHVDFIDKRENRALVIMDENNRPLTKIRFKNTASEAKFTP
jgi:hypothetical protein